MDFGKQLDKLNTPIYICDDNWQVIYRNKACKKYTTSPRTNSGFDRCFVDKASVLFPAKDGGFNFVLCKIKENYKTALCFEYSGFAVVMFPLMMEYEYLFGKEYEFLNNEVADCARALFDTVINNDFINTDKYGMAEKLRKYIFSSVENYVAFSAFENQSRCAYSIDQLYRFLYKRILGIIHKAGYKVEIDLSGLEFFGGEVFVDTAYFTSVFSSLLLFCMSVSKDKKCIISAENMGSKVRNRIKLKYPKAEELRKCGDTLNEFLLFNPIDYFNVIPYEELCRSIGWKIGYNVDCSSELNLSIYFDVDIDNNTEFHSDGTLKAPSVEKIVEDIISVILLRLF